MLVTSNNNLPKLRVELERIFNYIPIVSTEDIQNVLIFPNEKYRLQAQDYHELSLPFPVSFSVSLLWKEKIHPDNLLPLTFSYILHEWIFKVLYTSYNKKMKIQNFSIKLVKLLLAWGHKTRVYFRIRLFNAPNPNELYKSCRQNLGMLDLYTLLFANISPQKY